MQKYPFVSIIIVNYNGKRFLNDCFLSLAQLDYPEKRYEIIMVDNNSNDISVDFTKKNFPSIKIIESKKNLGFAGGCNLGVEYAKGKYIALLNNDTIVDKHWLSALVKTIESDSNIAAVNSKVLLFYPFIEIKIHSDIFLRSEFTNTMSFQPVGVLVENVVLENQGLQNLVRYRTGFYERETGPISARWTKGDATILIPLDPNSTLTNFTLTIRSEKSSSNLKTNVSVKVGTREVIKGLLEPYEVKQYFISLNTNDLSKYYLYEVQNCGVAVFKNGYGRDRGAVVRGHIQFYEIDNTFYDQQAEIMAFSGASVIINKKIYKKLGGFDESFFMYYEDVDFSLRLKRLGYKIIYEPQSMLRHIHSGSSGEWSYNFNYNVEKNHLALLIKHFSPTIIIKEYFFYFFLLIIAILKMIKWRIKEHWEWYETWKERVECRRNVLIWEWNNMLLLIKKRILINRSTKVSLKELYAKLY